MQPDIGKVGDSGITQVNLYSTQATSPSPVDASNPAFGESMSPNNIRKLHIPLGHVSDEIRHRAFLHSQQKIDIDVIRSAILACPCGQTEFEFQRPLVHIKGIPAVAGLLLSI